jgi:hypothetical protein
MTRGGILDRDDEEDEDEDDDEDDSDDEEVVEGERLSRARLTRLGAGLLLRGGDCAGSGELLGMSSSITRRGEGWLDTTDTALTTLVSRTRSAGRGELLGMSSTITRGGEGRLDTTDTSLTILVPRTGSVGNPAGLGGR